MERTSNALMKIKGTFLKIIDYVLMKIFWTFLKVVVYLSVFWERVTLFAKKFINIIKRFTKLIFKNK